VNAENYKQERRLRGTQTSVAAQLGVGQVTIARRETGVSPITTEAWLALLSLPKKRKKKDGL
jgi:predicted transcriptional regulator